MFATTSVAWKSPGASSAVSMRCIWSSDAYRHRVTLPNSVRLCTIRARSSRACARSSGCTKSVKARRVSDTAAAPSRCCTAGSTYTKCSMPLSADVERSAQKHAAASVAAGGAAEVLGTLSRDSLRMGKGQAGASGDGLGIETPFERDRSASLIRRSAGHVHAPRHHKQTEGAPPGALCALLI